MPKIGEISERLPPCSSDNPVLEALSTVAQILQLAAPLKSGFYIKIKNEPWMELVVEDAHDFGPNNLPVISVAYRWNK